MTIQIFFSLYLSFSFLFSLSFPTNLWASEISYIARSPRAMLMGDAYTAIADDEFTLFYNPAALGRNKGVSFTLIDPSLSIIDAIAEIDRFNNFPKTAPLIAERIMNMPLYLQAGIFPNLKMGQLGFSFFANSKSSLVLRNAIHPAIDLNYRYDRGFIFGYAYNLMGTGTYSSKKINRTAPSVAGKRLSIGVSVKHLTRQGIEDQCDLFGTGLLSKISAGSLNGATAVRDAFGYSVGNAWGYDVGAEYAIANGHSIFTSAFSILDIASTKFTKTYGDKGVPAQNMMINAGMAFKQDFGIFDYTLSVDMHPINAAIDFGRKFHFGGELSIPFLTFYGGWNEGYLSYGASVKLWPIKITTGFYGVEAGSRFKEQEAARFIFYISLFDFSIDL